MDSFDDFEMKPITTGLGFHKRKTTDDEIIAEVKREIPKLGKKNMGEEQELQELMSALDRVSNNLAGSLKEKQSSEKSRAADLNRDIEFVDALPRKAIQLETPPLGRHMPSIIEESPKSKKNPGTIPDVVRREEISMPQKKVTKGVRRGAADSPAQNLKPAVFSFSSAILDIMVVLAIALLFLISLLLVTGVKLTMVFKGMQNDFMTQVSLAMLYIAILQLYVIISRSFFGKTLGEWTFDYQLGDDKQIQSSVYPLLVLWRSLVIMCTGVIMLPLLSLLVRKDLASYLTGLQLYKKP